MAISAIYAIRNTITFKVYVGSSIDVSQRFNRHYILLSSGRHFNRYFQAAWNAHGEQNFEFVILEYIGNKLKLLEREQHWLDLTESYNKKFGYNLSPTAGSPLGVVHSAETRAKMSAWQKGRTLPEETKIKQSMAGKGRIFSDEHRRKLSLAGRGKKQSQDQINNAVEARRKNSPWQHSDGRKCKCLECVLRKRELKRQWRRDELGSGLK